MACVVHNEQASLRTDSLLNSAEIPVQHIIPEMLFAPVTVPAVRHTCIVRDQRLVIPVFGVDEGLVSVLVGDLLTVAAEMDIYLVAGSCFGCKLFQSRDNCSVCCSSIFEAGHVCSAESIVRKHLKNNSPVIPGSYPVPARLSRIIADKHHQRPPCAAKCIAAQKQREEYERHSFHSAFLHEKSLPDSSSAMRAAARS